MAKRKVKMAEPTVGITAMAEAKGLRELATGKKERKLATRKPRQAKRGLLAAGRADARRVVTQRLSRDEFGEMGARKKGAAGTAHANGHQLGPWHKRPGDTYGRQDAYCVDCNMAVTVAVDEPAVYHLPLIYGDATTKKCPNVEQN